LKRFIDKYRKKAILMYLCSMIATAILVNAALWSSASAQLIIVYVWPHEQTVNVCENFTVYVNIEGVEPQLPVFDYDFFLFYDDSKMTPLNASDGGFLQPSVIFSWVVTQGAVHCGGVTLDGGSIGGGTLAVIEFHCDAPGDSLLSLEVLLSDAGGGNIFPDVVEDGVVHQVSPPVGGIWVPVDKRRDSK